MCIIAYKPLNKAFMPQSVLAECFKNNPDGAGFMFCANGKVHIRKGFMTFDDFNAALNAVRTKYGDKIPYVMHFRISTQAGVNQQCCHPYPLSSEMSNLKKLSCSTHIGIAHNGIIHLTSDAKAKGYNDTMKFITDYVTLLIKKVDWWRNPNIAKALEQLCESKLAIMGNDGHVELIGDFVKDKGCYYSNSTYKESKYTWSKLAKWSDWDDWSLYLDPKSKKYDFQDTYCPLSMDGDDDYCTQCKRCKNCSLLRQYLDDNDTLIQNLA